jgi:ribose transport system ATP-binding protein
LSLTGLPHFTSKLGKINQDSESAAVAKYIDAFSIKADGIDATISQLSGGNQQKVSIGKSLVPAPKILILDEPTRGVDVGAKREIYTLINELKAQGLCILLMSSDMPELLGISDRILVMSNGLLTGAFNREEANQEVIMHCTLAGFNEGNPE